jgi:nucleoside-diphosphate-sugar epimerase
MSILVTGGCGLVGTFTSRELASRGYKVVAYDIDLRPSLVEDLGSDIKLISGNVCDMIRLLNVIKDEQIDHIIHAASILTHEAEIRPLEAFRTNVEGSLNVFEAARLMNIKRVIHMSSVSVYDLNVRTDSFEEEHPFGPGNIYGITKMSNEFLAWNYIRNHGLDIIMFRPSMIWGPGQRAETGGGRIIKPLIENAFFNKTIDINPKDSYDMVYVKDVADVICKACFTKNTKLRVFNIGSGRYIELKEMLDAVKKFMPNTNINILPGEHDPLYAAAGRAPASILRVKEKFGFGPKFDLESGVSDYIKFLDRWHNKM